MVKKGFYNELSLHIMLLPGVLLVIVYSYGPMVGILMAFEKYIPNRGIFGSEWVGFDNFRYMLALPDMMQVLWNTVFIALMKIIAGLFVPVVFALLLNEIGQKLVKRSIQTAIYLPYFLSWIILGGILIDFLSPSSGLVNHALGLFGFEPIFFLGDADLFPYVMVVTDVWKGFGFNTIIYLAALTNIDPNLYEATFIDGAGRWKQTLYITIPGIMPIVVLMGILSLGNVLNAGFDQIFNLYSPQVYRTGDIIDTLVYRLGLQDFQFGVATAVGLFKSVVSFIFISVSYRLAYKSANYRIF